MIHALTLLFVSQVCTKKYFDEKDKDNVEDKGEKDGDSDSPEDAAKALAQETDGAVEADDNVDIPKDEL